ncbi:MAG: subfamily polymerase sigma-24 subunit [Pseudonocardiales bacterium]|nr:subfamily polymerase sigma-24 subunit [Pseudonocardiales bacterium]
MDAELGFAGFVRANTAALLRTAYLLTGNAPAAEELVQDTLVRLFPKWDKVQAADVPLAYVRRSVTNAFVNERRRPASRELVLDVLPERHDPRDATDQLADRDEIWIMLRTLPDRQRAALVMRYFHDLPDDEIADALGCRVGTVRSLISRGLVAMREARAAQPPSARRFE